MYRLPDLFNPEKVRKMVHDDPGLLSRLASEPEENVKRRAELKEQEKSLKAACDLCRENTISSSAQFGQPATEYSTPERGSPYEINGKATTSTHERSSSPSSASVESDSTSLTVPSRGHSHRGRIGGSKPQDWQEENEEL